MVAGLTSSRTSRRSSACSLVASELMLSMVADAAYLAEAAMPVEWLGGRLPRAAAGLQVRMSVCLAGRG